MTKQEYRFECKKKCDDVLEGKGISVLTRLGGKIKHIDHNDVSNSLVNKYTDVQKDLGGRTILERQQEVAAKNIAGFFTGKRRRRRR